MLSMLRKSVSGPGDGLREDLRLDVVGVACELVTLEARIREEARQAFAAGAAPIVGQAETFAAKAKAVLSRSANLEEFSDDALRCSSGELCELAAKMRRLRAILQIARRDSRSTSICDRGQGVLPRYPAPTEPGTSLLAAWIVRTLADVKACVG